MKYPRSSILLASLLLLACSSEPSDADVDEAYETASEEMAGTTFEEVGDSSTCTDDCGGHDAGYEWAQEQGVTDASECGGKSQSFIEGCETYASEIESQASDILEE